jgi:hypothetical protein
VEWQQLTPATVRWWRLERNGNLITAPLYRELTFPGVKIRRLCVFGEQENQWISNFHVVNLHRLSAVCRIANQEELARRHSLWTLWPTWNNMAYLFWVSFWNYVHLVDLSWCVFFFWRMVPTNLLTQFSKLNRKKELSSNPRWSVG